MLSNMKPNNAMDLFMKPVKQRGFINIHKDPFSKDSIKKSYVYMSYETAFANRSHNHIDTIEIEWEE
jgi:hypothetical protein